MRRKFEGQIVTIDAGEGEAETVQHRQRKREQSAHRYRLEEAITHIYAAKEPPEEARVLARGELYDFARAQLGDLPITYLEFGVRHGRSMSRIMSRFTHPDARFYGFDSFEGLPEQWTKMRPGTFSTDGNFPNITDPRAKFVKGWFQNTLPEFLSTNALTGAGPLFVHFDADLYSSTLFLLTSLWHVTSEYYFIFDEFMRDEIIAMHDFTRAYPLEYEFFSQTTTSVYTQIFGRMKRVEFRLKA
jgi:hypothetical protein